jgi:4-hydroxybenzoate polyprenyltransferase
MQAWQVQGACAQLQTPAAMCCVARQGPNDVSRRALWGLLTALVPALLMNVCIVGINQIFDVAIDKVRRPLPCIQWLCNSCTAL